VPVGDVGYGSWTEEWGHNGVRALLASHPELMPNDTVAVRVRGGSFEGVGFPPSHGHGHVEPRQKLRVSRHEEREND
jgi:hypothetical protein